MQFLLVLPIAFSLTAIAFCAAAVAGYALYRLTDDTQLEPF